MVWLKILSPATLTNHRTTSLIHTRPEVTMADKPVKRFGQVAIEHGFITLEQLTSALALQAQENLKDGCHQLIGEILVNQEFITEQQVKEVLEIMNQQMISKISIGR